MIYNLFPDKYLRLKGESCAGGKLSKERVTTLIGANMSETEKRKLLAIGKSKNSKCFKNIKNLFVKYEANTKAWMPSQLFEKELRNWDVEMRKKRDEF